MSDDRKVIPMIEHIEMEEDRRTFIERVFSNPGAIATILLAVVGQTVVSIAFQIINNEQQEAKITANALALSEFKSAVNNLQTPLSNHVFKLEEAITDIRKVAEDLSKRLDVVDTAGTRALSLVVANQQRVMSQLDRFGERLLMQDRELVELKSKAGNPVLSVKLEELGRNETRLEEQQRRIIEALDNLYSQVSKIPPALRAEPPRKRQ